MNTRILRSLADDSPGGLRALAAPAPATLATDVLVEVGLADRMAPIDSPLGTLWVAFNGRGVSEVEQAEDGAAAAARHAARTGRPTTVVPSPPPKLADAIARRLAGERRVRIPLDLRGRTEFEVAVWTKALEIPRGEVRPYGWIAAEIGRPKAVRAVGTALGHNPVPLIVPCHRVVRTDGTIGQYSLGGPRNKRTILSAEGLDPEALEAAARGGERLSGSTTTRIVCWPTCRHARRVQGRYRVSFRSLREARAKGYRPCKICRPVAVEAAA
jgi:O-6-methylguanine DNA methyltransferase